MAELDIIIKATDRGATRTVKGISGEIQKLDRQASTSFDRLGKALGTGLKVAAGIGAAAVAGLGATLWKAVQAGSDVEEMMGKFNVVFGDFAGQTVKDLDDMALAMRRNKFDLRGFASTFQDTFVPMGFARDEAAGLSKQLTQLTIDLASFNNASEPEVMAALQSALVGNHETMRQFGVIITQTTLDQELLNMGIAGGIKEASEMEKALARLNIIMAGTADAQGDAERTAGSWANTMRAMRAAIDETFADLGDAILPKITPIFNSFTDWLRNESPKVVDGFAEMLRQIDLKMSELRTAWALNLLDMRGTFQRFQEQQIPQVKSLWQQILDIFGIGQDKSKSQWQKWITDLLHLWENFGNMALAIFSELLRAIRGAQLAWQGLVTHDWSTFWSGIGQILEAALDAVLHQIEYVFGPGTRNTIVSFLHWVWFSVTETIRRVQELFSTMLTWPTLPPLLQGILPSGPAGAFANAIGQNVTTNNFAVNITGVRGDTVGVARASRDGVLSAARRMGL